MGLSWSRARGPSISVAGGTAEPLAAFEPGSVSGRGRRKCHAIVGKAGQGLSRSSLSDPRRSPGRILQARDLNLAASAGECPLK